MVQSSTTEIWRQHCCRQWGAWRQHSEEADTKPPTPSTLSVLSPSSAAFTPLLTSSSSSSSSSSTSWPSSLTPSCFSPCSTSSTWLVGVASLTGVELLGAETLVGQWESFWRKVYFSSCFFHLQLESYEGLLQGWNILQTQERQNSLVVMRSSVQHLKKDFFCHIQQL